MRKIKFRGISKLTDEWTYGYYYNMSLHKGENELRHIIVYENKGPGNQTEHEPIDETTLGQYTGLKDINGKEIYEGDIVKCTGMIELTGVIEFKDCEFCIKYKRKYDRQFNYKSLKENEKYNDRKCSFDLKNTFEIIGNVYENKELLNKL